MCVTHSSRTKGKMARTEHLFSTCWSKQTKINWFAYKFIYIYMHTKHLVMWKKNVISINEKLLTENTYKNCVGFYGDIENRDHFLKWRTSFIFLVSWTFLYFGTKTTLITMQSLSRKKVKWFFRIIQYKNKLTIYKFILSNFWFTLR